MTFDSLTFALFLAIVFPIYVLARSWSARKNWLVLASCVFYGAWNPFFLLLLGFTTVFDWWAGLRIHAACDESSRRRWMIASIVASLSILVYFKYAQFFANTAIAGLATIGVNYQPIDLGLILPLGISFYIFESISYIVDVYKRRIEPTKNLRDYTLFMTFFPHLVAGPIMRYRDFGGQIATPRRVTADNIALGGYLAIGGLFLKIVCADHVFAPIANFVFAPDYKAGFVGAWMGALAFSMQLFCDFAGYSLAAIGIARMLGFILPSNFEAPFAAIGFVDLWRRWHISLSSWLRDYVYLPLLGDRLAKEQFGKALVALIITFAVSGLWHGAAWHFVVWGLAHGALVALERIVKHTSIASWNIWNTLASRVLLGLGTFLCFTLVVVFFRATELALAWSRFTAMLGFAAVDVVGFVWNGEAKICAFGVLVALIVHALLRRHAGWDWVVCTPWFARTLLLSFMLIALILSPGKTAAFIYFQF
jgi:alginate O-acetyltransferase complex protein AlgI